MCLKPSKVSHQRHGGLVFKAPFKETQRHWEDEDPVDQNLFPAIISLDVTHFNQEQGLRILRGPWLQVFSGIFFAEEVLPNKTGHMSHQQCAKEPNRQEQRYSHSQSQKSRSRIWNSRQFYQILGVISSQPKPPTERIYWKPLLFLKRISPEGSLAWLRSTQLLGALSGFCGH